LCLLALRGHAAQQGGGADEAGLSAEGGADYPQAGDEVQGRVTTQGRMQGVEEHRAGVGHAAADDHQVQIADRRDRGDHRRDGLGTATEGSQCIGIPGGEFVLLPLCYGLAALAICRIDLQEAPRPPRQASVWQEIGEGVAVLRNRPSVRSAMAHLVLLYSLLAALYVLAISMASLIPGLGPTQFGTLLAMSGVGLALGAVLVAQLGAGLNRRRLAADGLGIMAWTLVLLGQVRGNLVFTLLLCALLGVGAALLAIPAQTTIQEDTPEAMRGKVFGLQNNLINVALSLPLVLAGTVVSRYGLLPVLWILAGLSLAAALMERPWQGGSRNERC
jgi:hypothetical protein